MQNDKGPIDLQLLAELRGEKDAIVRLLARTRAKASAIRAHAKTAGWNIAVGQVHL